MPKKMSSTIRKLIMSLPFSVIMLARSRQLEDNWSFNREPQADVS